MVNHLLMKVKVIILLLFAGGLSTSSSEECLSGELDAITLTSDGRTYAFKGNFVVQLNDAGNDIADGYPKRICDVFRGLPSNIDAAIHWRNRKTYFFKGSQYWRTSGTSVDDGYPLSISEYWPGLPNDIDAAVVWARNGKAYFFKGTNYWRFNPFTDTTEAGYLDINTYWPGYNQGSVEAALQWSNGRTYLFKGEQYWRYNDEQVEVDSGYPLWTTRQWFGCSTDGPTSSIETVCEDGCSDINTGCMSGSFDAITRTADGDTYGFKDSLVAKLNASGTEIARGYPKPICEVFPGLPSNLDAAIHWTNEKTYFFKGDQYWRTSGTSVDCGYPIQISDGWPGLPNNIDAAVLWGGNSKGYFFKGTKYWRYNPITETTEDGNLDTNRHWRGYDQGSVDAAFQWSSGHTYLFKGEQYWRYNDEQDRVDPGYPRRTSKYWFSCPTDGPTILIDEVCVPDLCSNLNDLGCVSGDLDAITRTSDGNTYAFKGKLVAKLNAAGTKIESGYPKPICAVFPGLPSNLDAAVHWTNEKTYFFKGDQYWRTTGTVVDCGYPIRISDGWPGLPNDIDAAVLWGRNSKGYFFKGTKYWRYNPAINALEAGNLDTNTHWPGYNRGSVDAALQWSNGRTYLFKGEQYWRYNDEQDRVDSEYPLWTTRQWFDCPTDGPTIPLTGRCLPSTCV